MLTEADVQRISRMIRLGILSIADEIPSPSDVENWNAAFNMLPPLQEKQEEQLSVLYLLKRMVKLMEPLGVVNIQGIQRVTVEGTVYNLPTTYPIGSTMSNIPTAGPPASAGTVYYQPTWAGPIDPRWTNMQNAKISYNTGIRAKLINS